MPNSSNSPNPIGSAICSIDDVSKHWGKSKNTIYRWIRKGEFPKPFYHVNKCYWFADDIIEHQNSLAQKPDRKSTTKS